MSDFLISDLFEPRIDKLCSADPRLKNAYGKVKCRFIEFAELEGLSFHDLRLYHICTLSGKINIAFTEFLNSVTRRKIKSHRPHFKYKREILVVAKRIVSVTTGQNGTENNLSIAERQAPSWMEPILDLLPRNMPYSCRRKLKKEGKHRNYPLTLNGEMILESFLTVAQNYDIRSFETLPSNFISESRAEIRKTPRGISPRNIIQSLKDLARKLSLTTGKQPSNSFGFKDWPPKLKQQFGIFKKLAVNEIEINSTLGLLAKFYKINFYQSKDITIDKIQVDLERGLGHCGPLPEDFGIEDLLTLKERKVTLYGTEKIEKYNEFVDKYREREQNRESNVKRAGFDSGSFAQFKNAIVSIAKYNGFFSLMLEFRKEYSFSFDLESKRKRKAEKKSAFALKDIDLEINMLGKRFFKIVTQKLFMPHPDRSVSETKEALKICIYYPILLTFRYTGLRQGNVRNCRMMRDPENYADPDGNIGIKKDGTLVFHFTEKETKNGKKLHAEFNLKQHSETHGALIRGVTKYLKQVHPFIISSHPNGVKDQSFAYIPRKGLKFQRFLASDARSFHGIFTSWSRNLLAGFLNTPERQKHMLNPHFFRGVCCDWLHDVLKFSFDQIGEYIGDAADTVKLEYIDRNRTHDATYHVTLKNIELRLTKKEEEDRDTFFESIMRRYHQLEQENDKNKEKIKSLEEELREKNRQIDELKTRKDAVRDDPEEEEDPSD